jgi:hypothetical protein
MYIDEVVASSCELTASTRQLKKAFLGAQMIKPRKDDINYDCQDISGG